MNMKFLKVLAPLCLSVTALTGCGSKMGPAGTDNLDVTIDTRGATISFWTGFGSKVNEVLEPLLEQFQQKTGITVEYESKGGYSNLQTAINLSATKKQYANVAVGYPDHFAGYINSNIQLRLDGLIANDSKREVAGKDAEGYDIDKDGIRLMNYSDFYSDYVTENETLEFDGEGNGYVLGLPFNKSSEVMVYNSQFFDWVATQDSLKANIFVPTTWAEVKSVGLAVKSYFATKGIYGKFLMDDGNVYNSVDEAPADHKTIIFDASGVATEDEFRLLSYDSTENLFITLVRQFGGTYTELDKTTNGRGFAVFNDADHKQQTLAAMAMYRDLGENKIVGIPATFGESLYCSNPFKAGKSLLNIGSTGGLSNAVGGFKVKAAPIPQNGNIPAKKYVISQGTNLALFNKGTEKEKVAAWKLMVFLSQQVNGTFASGTGYFPTCNAAFNSTDYQEYMNDSFDGAAQLQLEAAKINSETYGKSSDGWERFVDPAFRGSSAVRQEVGYIPGYILSGEIGDDQAILDDVYTKIRDYVKA